MGRLEAERGKGVTVKVTEEGSPSHQPGAPGDEIVAIDGYRTRTIEDVNSLLSSLALAQPSKLH